MAVWEVLKQVEAGLSDASAAERPPARRNPAEQGGEAQQSLPPAAAAIASTVNEDVPPSRGEPEEEPTVD